MKDRSTEIWSFVNGVFIGTVSLYNCPNKLITKDSSWNRRHALPLKHGNVSSKATQSLKAMQVWEGKTFHNDN